MTVSATPCDGVIGWVRADGGTDRATGTPGGGAPGGGMLRSAAAVDIAVGAYPLGGDCGKAGGGAGAAMVLVALATNTVLQRLHRTLTPPGVILSSGRRNLVPQLLHPTIIERPQRV